MDKGVKKFNQLKVWQTAHLLVLDVYKLSYKLPDEEKFGLISQMRRAAVSVPANIVEGFKRTGIKDKIRLYNIAQSSLEELRYYFILCKDLNYGIESNLLEEKADQTARLLTGLVKSISRYPVS